MAEKNEEMRKPFKDERIIGECPRCKEVDCMYGEDGKPKYCAVCGWQHDLPY